MNNPRGLFFNVDVVTILVYVALCIIGWFNIHAAVYDAENPSIFDLDTNYGKQLLYIVTALILGTVILIMDSKFFNNFSPIFYGVTILLLILVLIVGRNVGGNQAWIPIGSFRLQPSEFAKFASCLLLARYLSSSQVKLQEIKTQIIAATILFIPVGLIMLQPDTGSALAFTALIFVLYREGQSKYFLLIEGLLILLFILALLISKLYLISGLVLLCAFLIYNYRKNGTLSRLLFTALSYH